VLIPIIPYQQRYLSQICSNDSSCDSLINTTSVWTTIKNRFWSLHIIVTRSNWAPDSLKARLRLPQTLHLRMRLGTPNLCFPHQLNKTSTVTWMINWGPPFQETQRHLASVLWVVIASTGISRHLPGLDFCMALQRRVSAVRNLCSAWHGHQHQPEFPKPLKLWMSSAHALKPPPQISHTAPKASKKQGPSANSDLMCTSNLCPINMCRYHCIQWLYPVKCNLIPSQQTQRMPHCTWSTTDLQLDSMLGGTDVKSLEISWLNVPELKMGVYFPKFQDNPLGVGNLFSKLQVPGQSTRQEAAE
jgi:hypothetical protein